MSAAYPLYNTTYTLHRLSPLHAFPALTPAALKPHAKALLSLLRGDVLRGVRVRADDGEDDTLGRAGRLQGVTWEPLPTAARWRQQQQQEEDEEVEVEEEGETETRGVSVVLEYEKARYTSLLLLGSGGGGGEGAFTSFPLLLTRLPRSVRDTLLGYLSSTFDTAALPLQLESAVIKSFLENWLSAATANDGDEEEVGGGGKDVQIVFSPPGTGTTLKAITITVPRGDIGGFLRRGRRIVAVRERAGEGPFFEALRVWAAGTMGMEIGVLRVMKVACGGFVVGVGAGEGPGKVKVFVPRGPAEERAAEGLVAGLVEAAGR